ncbi:MAG: hypothetical protein ACOCRO_10380 [Halanaerobiales bacterium]
MDKTKILILFVMGMLLFPLVSANGLEITNNKEIDVTKIQGEEKTVDIGIKNTENFNMTNITTEDNDYISIEPFELESGVTKNVTAEIIAEEDVSNEDVEVLGYFEAELGDSEGSEEIDIYDDSVEECDTSIYKGDNVTFNNNADFGVSLKNLDSGELTDIKENESYTFNNMNNDYEYKVMDYESVERVGGCKINVLDNKGSINDPTLNAILNLNVDYEYKPTKINTSLSKDNYTIEFNKEQDGILSITNDGDEDAKDINLSGKWLKFNENDFNVEKGYSENIGYTIDPNIGSTEQTNQTYDLELKIEGNFETETKNISVFVPHAEIGYEDDEKNESLTDFIERYCNNNPNVCNTEPQVKYVPYNESDSEFNVTFSQRQFNKFQRDFYSHKREEEVSRNDVKESLSELKNVTEGRNQRIRAVEEKVDNWTSSVFTAALIFGIIIVIGMGSFLFKLLYDRKVDKEASGIW